MIALIFVLVFILPIVFLLNTGFAWLCVEEIGQFTDLTFREAAALGLLLMACNSSVATTR